jgi:hypothetical protein
VGIDGITIGETCGNPLLLLVYVVVVVVGWEEVVVVVLLVVVTELLGFEEDHGNENP